MKKLIRIGSRESDLALVQTNWVVNEIKKRYPDYEFQIVKIKTKGDKILDTRLDKIGGKGLFIKELEQALINNEVDIAVHSMKDMPAEVPEELSIEIVSKREDPRDVLLTANGVSLQDLKEDSVIGTSSVRREVQILNMGHNFKIKTLRGNVLTRIKKLLNNEYAAIILAAAGLKRLGLDKEHNIHFFNEETMIPAVGQGILCVQTRKGEDINYLLETIYCEESAFIIKAERAFMVRLNGGCSMPIAAHATIDGDKMRVIGMIASDDKSNIFRDEVVGDKKEAACLGEKLAEILLKKKVLGG